MDIQTIRQQYDQEERRDAVYPDLAREVSGSVVRFVRPAPGVSLVLYSELDETTADAAIDEQLAYFMGNRLPFEWKVYSHDRPADLAQRLVARGLAADEPDAVMVLDVNAAPESLLRPPAADVRRLTDPSQLADVVAVLEPVWGRNFDWVYRRLGSHMAVPDYISVYVAYVDGAPACAGWTYFGSGQFAGMWGGSTVAAYRGRGLYSAVLSARVQEARQRGVNYLCVDAGEMSKPILARHGFEVMAYASAVEWRLDGGDEE